jgi:hypothetical protein
MNKPIKVVKKNGNVFEVKRVETTPGRTFADITPTVEGKKVTYVATRLRQTPQ